MAVLPAVLPVHLRPDEAVILDLSLRPPVRSLDQHRPLLLKLAKAVCYAANVTLEVTVEDLWWLRDNINPALATSTRLTGLDVIRRIQLILLDLHGVNYQRLAEWSEHADRNADDHAYPYCPDAGDGPVQTPES